MKKTIIGIFAVAALTASQALAITVTFSRPAGYATGEGGEFNITPVFSGGVTLQPFWWAADMKRSAWMQLST